jgi:hypothetical protein
MKNKANARTLKNFSYHSGSVTDVIFLHTLKTALEAPGD